MATLSGAFTVAKTAMFIAGTAERAESWINTERVDVNSFYVRTNGVAFGTYQSLDDILTNTTIEIRVYP